MPGAPCQSVRPEDFGTGPCLHKSASAGQGSYWRISCRRRRSGVRLANDAGVVFILIEPGRRFAKGEVSRLVAPALDATAGVRFGGAAVDDYGGWAPAAREAAQFDGGAVVLDIPGASAALVTLQVT